jgi:hypothetical protein
VRNQGERADQPDFFLHRAGQQEVSCARQTVHDAVPQ